MNDFRRAYDALIAELTPQEWTCTTLDGATLTVVPDGLVQEPGDAEVTVRLGDREIGVTTAGAPEVLAALRAGGSCQYVTVLRDALTLTLTEDGGVRLHLETHDGEASGVIAAAGRLPLASALERAVDVARSWECALD